MKKFVRVLLILAACLACLGVVLTAVGGFWSARVYNRLIPEEAVSISFPLNADTLSSLTLNVGVGEVRFAEAPSPEAARMDTEGFSEGDFTFSENKQGEVVLRSRSMLGGESIFNLGFLRMDWLGRLHTGTLARRIVTVYLPAGQLDRLRIEGGTGDIGGTLPVSARELSISCGTGNVKLSGLRADDISIEAGMGNITLDQLICKKLTVSGGTGGLTLRDGEASESAVFELGTGTTQLHRVALHKLDLSARCAATVKATWALAAQISTFLNLRRITARRSNAGWATFRSPAQTSCVWTMKPKPFLPTGTRIASSKSRWEWAAWRSPSTRKAEKEDLSCRS